MTSPASSMCTSGAIGPVMWRSRLYVPAARRASSSALRRGSKVGFIASPWTGLGCLLTCVREPDHSGNVRPFFLLTSVRGCACMVRTRRFDAVCIVTVGNGCSRHGDQDIRSATAHTDDRTRSARRSSRARRNRRPRRRGPLRARVPHGNQGARQRQLPRGSRDTRLALLSRADVMLVVRTGLSESGAFEVGYNIYGGRRIPMLFAVWDEAEIKTTLLRDLDDLAKVRYVRFSDPASVASELAGFLDDVVVPDMAARGRTVEPAFNEKRAATSFREARRAARELGFPVAVRPWSAIPSQAVVVADLAGLVRYVEGDHVAINRERPLLVERATTLQARTKRVRIETGTFEPAAEAYLEVEAKTA